jgi:hypothetical protein
MTTLPQVCDTCNNGIKKIFDPVTGSRQSETISGDLYVPDRCFVRDEIQFSNKGRLIFIPSMKEGYFDEYYVICRKLIVTGGHTPGTLNPCGPDDPGTMYNGNNVITWQTRLNAAYAGFPANPAQAADGQDFGAWQDLGQGNDGQTGNPGNNGSINNPGNPGLKAPSFTLIALEVEIGAFDHLTIDFDGQNGGEGGIGQKGGKGGKGMRGRNGQSDTTWPGTGCDRQPGNGGKGGPGGNGGKGGDGGPGGDAGNITIFSTSENISSSGPFRSGNISYVNDGGSGGAGGKGGFGGKGGKGALAGTPTSECDNASPGDDGDDGWPPVEFAAGSDANKGNTGSHGAPGVLSIEEAKPDTCAKLLPMPIEVLSSLNPSVFCRGYSTPDTGVGSLTGNYLAQVHSVDVSLPNITATVKLSSTDTQLDLKFDIAGNSGVGTGNLILKPAFGTQKTLGNAIEVRRFEVLTIAPNTGARGADVNVQITGHCFDPSASSQDVSVSGLGVSVLNVLVLDAQTIQCVFSIGNLAALGARDVTVKTGLKHHTLLNAFTITG